MDQWFKILLLYLFSIFVSFFGSRIPLSWRAWFILQLPPMPNPCDASSFSLSFEAFSKSPICLASTLSLHPTSSLAVRGRWAGPLPPLIVAVFSSLVFYGVLEFVRVDFLMFHRRPCLASTVVVLASSIFLTGLGHGGAVTHRGRDQEPNKIVPHCRPEWFALAIVPVVPFLDLTASAMDWVSTTSDMVALSSAQLPSLWICLLQPWIGYGFTSLLCAPSS